MNQKMLARAVDLTQEMIVRFWQYDYKFAMGYFAENYTLIGSLQEQYLQGLDRIREVLHNTNLEQPPCHLMEQEFTVVQNCGSACTIIGRYLTTTDDTADYFMQSQQRCTFVWELINGELKLRHTHISDPMGELKIKKGELFAGTIGKMATEYYLRKAKNMNDSSRRLTVKGQGDTTHFISYSEIISVSAVGRDIEIRTCGGKVIKAHMSITEFIGRTNDEFALIHRCHAINPDYIVLIKQYQVKMADESIFPIPARRYVEVRDTLLNKYNTAAQKGSERIGAQQL